MKEKGQNTYKKYYFCTININHRIWKKRTLMSRNIPT